MDEPITETSINADYLDAMRDYYDRRVFYYGKEKFYGAFSMTPKLISADETYGQFRERKIYRLPDWMSVDGFYLYFYDELYADYKKAKSDFAVETASDETATD